MRYLICILISTFTFASIAGQKNVDGIGLVQPNFLHVEEPSGPTYLTLELYETPGSHSGDCIVREQEGSSNSKITLVENNGSESKLDFSTSGLVWTAYKSHSLQFYDEVALFVQIKLNGRKYWVAKEELAKYGFMSITWKDYFNETESKSIEVRFNMNLRDKPGLAGKKIELIQKNGPNVAFHKMKMTGRFAQNWAEVEVLYYQDLDQYCSGKTAEIKKVIGWIKYLDDTGFPNLFDTPTMCC